MAETEVIDTPTSGEATKPERHTGELSVAEIKGLDSLYLPAAVRAYEESMAGWRNTQDVFAGLEQKGFLLFSVLVTVLSGLIAFSLDADRQQLLWASIGAAVPVAGAMLCALMSLTTRQWQPPFTSAEHWVHYLSVETEEGYGKTLLWLAKLVNDPAWEPKNKAVLKAKAFWVDCTLVLMAASPIAGGAGALLANIL